MTEEDQERSWIERLRRSLASVIRGKAEAIDLLLVGVFSGGHVLIEDVPGVGKTTLAKALARAVDLEFSRVQFTPDLLPSDILGTHVLNPREGSLSFHRGPIFTNVLLADEINRASPRTQSALLEAMNEGQATIDGKTMTLPDPFLVLATQNPVDFQGTYPLPEAQLDRFVLRLRIGYPSVEEEMAMLFDRTERDPLDSVERVITRDELLATRAAVRRIEVKQSVARYLTLVCDKTRDHEEISLGASPRGTLVFFRACQARALMLGRTYVLPDDVQKLAIPVLSHRIQMTERARYGGRDAAATLTDILTQIPVPT